MSARQSSSAASASFVGASVRCGVTVQSLRRRDFSIGFVAETSEGRIEAANVVVATGPYQRPIIPTLLSNNAAVFQVHASRYRRPEQLPPGAVLVIGSGASGVQIAEELLRAGRQLYLSMGRHRRMPRRYRGRDLTWWQQIKRAA
jgi:putative flavoprotein involved in K+ transport